MVLNKTKLYALPLIALEEKKEEFFAELFQKKDKRLRNVLYELLGVIDAKNRFGLIELSDLDIHFA